VNPITKFLVVAAALLAVALSALTMAYATNASRVVADWRNEQARRIESETRLQDQQAQFGELQSQLEAEKQQLETDKAALNAEIQDLIAELAVLRSEKARAEIAAERIKNRIEQDGETVRIQTALIEAYSEEINQLRDAELDWNRREIELLAALNDRDGQIEVLEVSNRALQEQLKELELAAQTFASGGPAAGDGARGPITATRLVRGSVVTTSVEDATGDTLVEVDLGENDGIVEGMKLHIHRGSEYLADVVVERADLQSSVARVVLLPDPTETIRANDQVASLFR